MQSQYQYDIDKHKKQLIHNFKQKLGEENWQQCDPASAYTSRQINMRDLAIKDKILYDQLLLLTDLLKHKQQIKYEPFSCFLQVNEFFEDPSKPEVTYFLKGMVRVLKYCRFDILQQLWQLFLALQKDQIFIFNIQQHNIEIMPLIKMKLLDINNLIFLKFNEKVNEKCQNAYNPKFSHKFDQIVTNSTQIIKLDQFASFIRQKIDADYRPATSILSNLYYLNRKQFMKYVEITINNISIPDNPTYVQIVANLHKIKEIQITSVTQMNKKYVDKEISSLLYQCRKAMRSQENKKSIQELYRYPLHFNYKDYSEDDKAHLIHQCKQALNPDKVNLQLMRHSFEYIFRPRDFFCLEEQIQIILNSEIQQQEALLSLDNSIYPLDKEQLRTLLEEQKAEIIAIWQQMKRESCKFNIQQLIDQNEDNSSRCNQNYWKYNRQKIKIKKQSRLRTGYGRQQQCQLHQFPLRYSCSCGIKRELCYFCINSRIHSSHSATCGKHSQALIYRRIDQNEQRDEQEEIFACQMCKREQIPQRGIKYKRICATHRLPLEYACLSLHCNSPSLFCFSCKELHASHKEEIEIVPKFSHQDIQEKDNRNEEGQFKIWMKFSADKFLKYNQIFLSKIGLLAVFLDQLDNYSQNRKETIHQQLYKRFNQENSISENDILRLKVKKYLLGMRQMSENKEIYEYLEDKMERLTSNLFKAVEHSVQQFEKKALGLILNPNLHETAQDYLKQKYQTIVNKQGSSMTGGLMWPCRFNQKEISQHHFSKIKRVIIDEVLQRESDDMTKSYKTEIASKWAQFYQSQKQSQYSQLKQKLSSIRQESKFSHFDYLFQEISKLQAQVYSQQTSFQSKEQILQQIQEMKEQETNGGLLLYKIGQIEDNVKQRALEGFFQKHLQQANITQFSLAQKLPNLQCFQVELYNRNREHREILATQIVELVNSSEINFLSLDCFPRPTLDDILQKFQNISVEHFNKKISCFAFNDQEYSHDTRLKDQLKEIQRVSRHINFPYLNIEAVCYPDYGQRLKFPALKKLIDNVDKVGLNLLLNQHEQCGYFGLSLNQTQKQFVSDTFKYLKTKSHLLLLNLIGIQFSGNLSLFLKDLLVSNFALMQLTLNGCQQVSQDSLASVNPEIRSFNLRKCNFNGEFIGFSLARLTQLRMLVLDDVNINAQLFNYFSKHSVCFKDKLVELQLNIVLLFLYDTEQFELKSHSMKYFLSIFSECSIHRLVISLQDPSDLFCLKTNELLDLEILNCQKMNNDYLGRICNRWPRIKNLNLYFPFSQFQNRLRLWSSFKNAVEIKVGADSLTEEQLQQLRMNGTNMHAILK